ncbi:hypothetical protein TNCV_805651 [Trichonephila clavipes]|nr:hypothetical protein TNCV_805651 [Trichonephila clavipes]
MASRHLEEERPGAFKGITGFIFETSVKRLDYMNGLALFHSSQRSLLSTREEKKGGEGISQWIGLNMPITHFLVAREKEIQPGVASPFRKSGHPPLIPERVRRQ